MRYRGYTIEYRPPPIPLRDCDWEYVHQDYDGGPWDSYGPPMDDRCGWAASLEDAKRAVDELIAEAS